MASALAEQAADRRDSVSRSIAACLGALARIEAGVYGACERCGHHITAARLKALPETPWCIDCANLREREAADARAGAC